MSRTGFALLLSVAGFALTGCATDAQKPSGQVDAAPAVAVEKGGAQLWAENCSRCHNIRPPQSFSDAQWQAIAHHMRLRANLTGQETRAVTDFLQSSD
jgi:mono/diheme cytochrome c family protein